MNEYQLYIKQAWHLLRQNRFFSGVYIIGTGLAISMVMALAVVYHIQTANIAPENHRDRMCYLSWATYAYKGKNGTYNSALGIRYVKEIISSLEIPEAITVTSRPVYSFLYGDEMFAQVPGEEESPKIFFMACDANFWRVYDFRFLDGKPFDRSDFDSGLRRVVLCRSLARQLFGREAVSGEIVRLNEVDYTVCGVVADVSGALSDVYAQAWLPYSSMTQFMDESKGERNASVGDLQANILLRDKRDLPLVQAELEEAIKRYNTTLVDGQLRADEKIRPHGLSVMGIDREKAYWLMALFLLLFLLVPALNISGLNTSQIQDRMTEIGIRRAFGAPRGTLFKQIFVENLMLMLPGGLVGLFFSYGIVYLYKNILLVTDSFALRSGMGDTITLSGGMLLNWRVFLAALAVCLVLNLLSSLVPVWRAVRKDIVWSLNMSNR